MRRKRQGAPIRRDTAQVELMLNLLHNATDG